MAVCSRALVVLHANLVRREFEHSREPGAQVVDVLSGAHHESGVRLHISDRTIGPEGRMRLVRPLTFLRSNMCGRFEDVSDFAAFADIAVLRLHRAHMRVERLAAG